MSSNSARKILGICGFEDIQPHNDKAARILAMHYQNVGVCLTYHTKLLEEAKEHGKNEKLERRS